LAVAETWLVTDAVLVAVRVPSMAEPAAWIVVLVVAVAVRLLRLAVPVAFIGNGEPSNAQ
jgi:hypothetical protein